MKYCHKCGAEIIKKDKFCKQCGEKLLNDGSSKKNKNKKLNILNFEEKKNFFEALLWYVFALIMGSFLHYYYGDSSSFLYLTFFINTGMTVLSLISFVILKRWKFNKKTILSIIAGFLLSLIYGLPSGLIVVFYVLMSSNEKVEIPLEYSSFINDSIVRGYMNYLIGNIISIGGMYLAEEGGTYYLFWGLIFYGFYMIFKGIFFYIFPDKLAGLIEHSLKKTENEEYGGVKNNTTEVKSVKTHVKGMLKFLLIIIAVIVVLVLLGLWLDS